MKEYTIKRYYHTKNTSNFHCYIGQSEHDKVSELKRKLSGEQNVFMKFVSKSALLVKSSYAVANITAKNEKPYSDVQFIKECFETVMDKNISKTKTILWKPYVCFDKKHVAERMKFEVH